MDLSAPTIWWIACGVLIAVELATGTFYLLMLAIGCAAGAIAAHLALGDTVQVLCAALVGGGAVALWRRVRSRRSTPPADANPDVNLDIGQAVQVDAWSADGSARVNYRGAAWRARYAGTDAPPAAGRYVIRAIDGSCLVLDR